MGAAGWYVGRNGIRQGPYVEEQLMQMAADGQLATTDYLWQEGTVGWQLVSDRRDLFPPGTRFLQEGPAYDPSMRWVMPVGRSGWAIAAGYLGLFAVLLLPAPFALAIGIVAIVDIKKHPDKHGMGRAIFGVTMGAIFTTLLMIGIASSG